MECRLTFGELPGESRLVECFRRITPPKLLPSVPCFARRPLDPVRTSPLELSWLYFDLTDPMSVVGVLLLRTELTRVAGEEPEEEGMEDPLVREVFLALKDLTDRRIGVRP